MNTEKKLYQWDTGQKLEGCTGLYVDFPIDNEVYRVETADGMCIIPDELLQTSGGHKVYECMTNNTIRSFAFSVTPRPKPPDYVFTPTERLTFEGLVQKVDDAVADMIRKAESGEFDGHTPIKGTDYFTTGEIQQIQNEVSNGAIGDFKSVVDTETDKFNANATEKVNAYNQNDSEKTTSYNTNATKKLNAYNANADNRLAEFDSHTEQIQTDISELKSDLNAEINGKTLSVNSFVEENLDFETNATAFSSGNSYRTQYFKVNKDSKYVITLSSTNAATHYRQIYSENMPNAGVSGTLLDDHAFNAGAIVSKEFTYDAINDGFISFAYYKAGGENCTLSVTRLTRGLKEKINPIVDGSPINNLSTWQKGQLTNGVIISGDYRVVSTDIISTVDPIIFHIQSGRRMGLQYYDINGNYIEDAGWQTGEYITHPNSFFRIVISAFPSSIDAEYSYKADVDTFLSFITQGITYDILADEYDATNYTKTFSGEIINTKIQKYLPTLYAFNPIQPDPNNFEIPQDIAYYNNALFTCFNGAKIIMIQNAETGAEIARVQNSNIGHANTCMFSNEFYDVSDDYPLLYVSPEDGGNINVFRITTSALTLVKQYFVDTSETGYYMNMCLDAINNLLYTFGYTENSYDSDPNGTNFTIMCCFDLKNTTLGENNTIIPTLLFKKSLPFIQTHQGNTFFNNRIWMVSSDYTKHNTQIYVISPDGIITNIIGDFDSKIKNSECEGITFYPNEDKYNMLLLNGFHNKLYNIEFEN